MNENITAPLSKIEVCEKDFSQNELTPSPFQMAI